MNSRRLLAALALAAVGAVALDVAALGSPAAASGHPGAVYVAADVGAAAVPVGAMDWECGGVLDERASVANWELKAAAGQELTLRDRSLLAADGSEVVWELRGPSGALLAQSEGPGLADRARRVLGLDPAEATLRHTLEQSGVHRIVVRPAEGAVRWRTVRAVGQLR